MNIVERLLDAGEPCIRLKIATKVLGRKPAAEKVKLLQAEVRASERIRRLLSERRADGTLPWHPYTKWVGAHWLLATLADLGYPPADPDLIPLREQVYAWLLDPARQEGIVTIAGRVRQHASMEGNALYSLLTLGLADERTDELARRLREWQWPDGGWNCDKNRSASHSSFMETLIPLRGLALHARLTGSKESRRAAQSAADVFLKRRLFRRLQRGTIIRHEFVLLHYPPYWHYDILFALKVLAELGSLRDERCSEALDLLESKRLPDGGFPAEGTYYRTARSAKTGRSLVSWGAQSRNRMNEFVTAEALAVLRAAGRKVIEAE